MGKLATAIAAIAMIGTPALAADMAVKAPPPPPAPVYSWTGFYAGLNVGLGFGDANTNWNYLGPDFNSGATSCGLTGLALCLNGSDTVHMNGPLGGAQVGYNLQNGSYLVGIEADFQATSQSGTSTASVPFAINFINGGNSSVFIKEHLPWLGTVRGRIGYVADRLLVYATGGLAYGRVQTDSSASATGTPTIAIPNCGATCSLWNFSGSGVTKTGWSIGGGTEWAFARNWSAKLEYLFVDLGTDSTAINGIPACVGISGGACHAVAAGPGNISSRINDNVVRIGLNYQFH